MKDLMNGMVSFLKNSVVKIKRVIISDGEENDIITVYSENPYIQSIMEKVTHLKAANLNHMTSNGEKVTILDIRQPGEFTKTRGMKGNILNIPLNLLEIEAYEKLPDKKASIVVVSPNGISSGLAAYTLKNMGYTTVRNLKDGIQGWKQANKQANKK